MKLDVSTHVWPIVFVGTYDGQPMDYDSVFGDEIYEMENEFTEFGSGAPCIVLDDMSVEKWKAVIVEESQRVFNERKPLSKYGVSVTVTGMRIPTDHSRASDCLELSVEVPDDFFQMALDATNDSKNLNDIKDYIEKHWTDKPGFFSLMPETIADLRGKLKQVIDGEHYPSFEISGAALSVLSLVEGDFTRDEDDYLPPFEFAIRERITENHSPSEFQTVVYIDQFEREHGIRLKDIGSMLHEVREQRFKFPGHDDGFDEVERNIRDAANDQKWLVEVFLRKPSDANRRELEEFIETFDGRVQDHINESYQFRKRKEREQK